jgi:NAD(P)-dependent dehydrogenase (short-subunit alcohol dehydrogenase family)
MKKVAVITGASAGIGICIAQNFLDNGYKVFTISRRYLTPISVDHIHISRNLASWEECELACNEIKKSADKVDVLINNVGKSEWRSIARIDQNFFSEMMALNVASYFAMTKGLIDAMHDGASVINISSMAGKRGTKFNSMYCATKFAINGMTQSWAKEFGERGIRVNAICPVLIRSEGLEEALIKTEAPAEKTGVDSFLNEFTKSQAALGRLPNTQDVADFCNYLSSDLARSITGQCINLDCGVFPQ